MLAGYEKDVDERSEKISDVCGEKVQRVERDRYRQHRRGPDDGTALRPGKERRSTALRSVSTGANERAARSAARRIICLERDESWNEFLPRCRTGVEVKST